MSWRNNVNGCRIKYTRFTLSVLIWTRVAVYNPDRVWLGMTEAGIPTGNDYGIVPGTPPDSVDNMERGYIFGPFLTANAKIVSAFSDGPIVSFDWWAHARLGILSIWVCELLGDVNPCPTQIISDPYPQVMAVPASAVVPNMQGIDATLRGIANGI